jgi:cyclopropane-fatty-acyl-phospholipid synthase
MPATVRRDSGSGHLKLGASVSSGSTTSPTPQPSLSRRDRTASILQDLFGPPALRDFAIRYWDGHLESPDVSGAPAFTIVLKHPESLARMLLPPSQLRLAEAYIRGDFEVEGDLESAAGLANALRSRLTSPVAAAMLMVRLRRLPHSRRQPWRAHPMRGRRLGTRHSPRRDAAAIRFHYDLGNDFYALWLDRQMVYSCAYFPTGSENVHQAQEAKLEYLCRKLRLLPGERLLDIGCGWGALVRHAAARYGVEALGVTLSEEQARFANGIIAAQGMADRCRVEVRDYRELPAQPAFEKIVSVGMFEHVGRDQLKPYFARVFQLLNPGGLFLNHGINWVNEPERAGRSRLLPRWNWREGQFMDRYVFPDGDIVPLDVVIGSAEAAGFDVRDVENLREHYALTLRHWVHRLESSATKAIALVGERAYRTWRLYMSACASRFAAGQMAVAQTLLAKPDARGRVRLPLTRADLYVDHSHV